MSLYYFTFGQKYRHEPHPLVGSEAHPDGWFAIEAQDEEEARQKMHSVCGYYWAGCYSSPPDARLYDRGELRRIA